MTDTEAQIEQEIQDKGLNAPRLVPDDLDNEITQARHIHFHRFPDTAVTVCCVTLQNNFKVTGTSAAVSLENFDAALGRKIALKNAREQLWQLLGFRLADKIAAGGLTVAAE